MSTALEGGNSYLLIDHRRSPPEPGVSRIELWDGVSSSEVDDLVLLVMCDAGLAVDNVTTVPRLGDVVAALRARSQSR